MDREVHLLGNRGGRCALGHIASQASSIIFHRIVFYVEEWGSTHEGVCHSTRTRTSVGDKGLYLLRYDLYPGGGRM